MTVDGSKDISIADWSFTFLIEASPPYLSRSVTSSRDPKLTAVCIGVSPL